MKTSKYPSYCFWLGNYDDLEEESNPDLGPLDESFGEEDEEIGRTNLEEFLLNPN